MPRYAAKIGIKIWHLEFDRSVKHVHNHYATQLALGSSARLPPVTAGCVAVLLP